MAFKLLGEKEVEDASKAGEGEGQPKGQGQLFPLEPEGGDAILHNSRGQGWGEKNQEIDVN